MKSKSKPKKPSDLRVTVFKVRDNKTGLYSKGGNMARILPEDQEGNWAWGATGKTWPSVGALKNHLRMAYGIPSKVPDRLEVVECVTQVIDVFLAMNLWTK